MDCDTVVTCDYVMLTVVSLTDFRGGVCRGYSFLLLFRKLRRPTIVPF